MEAIREGSAHSAGLLLHAESDVPQKCGHYGGPGSFTLYFPDKTLVPVVVRPFFFGGGHISNRNNGEKIYFGSWLQFTAGSVSGWLSKVKHYSGNRRYGSKAAPPFMAGRREEGGVRHVLSDQHPDFGQM